MSVQDHLRKDLQEKLGEENLRKIEKARIGLAGAGGLGSNCAACLVRCGFRRLVIVDFDTVGPSNLDRQFYFADQVGMSKTEALEANLRRINPGLELTMVRKRIEKADIGELFGGCDVVGECLDRAEYKRMLVEELLSMGKPVVAVSGIGGTGDSDDIRIHRVKNNLIVIGDLVSDSGQKPVLSPRVSLAAAKQAHSVLEFVIHLPRLPAF